MLFRSVVGLVGRGPAQCFAVGGKGQLRLAGKNFNPRGRLIERDGHEEGFKAGLDIEFGDGFLFSFLKKEQGFAVKKTQDLVVGGETDSPFRHLQGLFDRASLPSGSNRGFGPFGGNRGRPIAVRGDAPRPKDGNQ